MINHHVNGLSIKNWANTMATYDNCGQGSHGKMDQIIATMHKVIHIIQQAMSIYLSWLSKYYSFE